MLLLSVLKYSSGIVDQRPRNDRLFFVISMGNFECGNAIIFFIYSTVL